MPFPFIIIYVISSGRNTGSEPLPMHVGHRQTVIVITILLRLRSSALSAGFVSVILDFMFPHIVCSLRLTLSLVAIVIPRPCPFTFSFIPDPIRSHVRGIVCLI